MLLWMLGQVAAAPLTVELLETTESMQTDGMLVRGETVTVTVRVTNTGTEPAQGVRLALGHPSNLSVDHVTSSDTLGPGEARHLRGRYRWTGRVDRDPPTLVVLQSTGDPSAPIPFPVELGDLGAPAIEVLSMRVDPAPADVSEHFPGREPAVSNGDGVLAPGEASWIEVDVEMTGGVVPAAHVWLACDPGQPAEPVGPPVRHRKGDTWTVKVPVRVLDTATSPAACTAHLTDPYAPVQFEGVDPDSSEFGQEGIKAHPWTF